MKFIFVKPGKYKIRTILRTPPDYLNFQYDTATIIVRQPDKSEEEEAQKMIINPESAKQIRKPTTLHGVIGIDLLEQLVNTYPKSVYADYARYSLGLYYLMATYNNIQKKKEFDMPLKKALDYSLGVTERNPSLRIRALCNICPLFSHNPTKRLSEKIANIREIFAEFDKHSKLIKDIGYQEKIDKIREEYSKRN